MASYRKAKTISLPMIHIQSVTPAHSLLNSGVLTSEIKMLMEEVSGLREETKSITCNCSDPDCPFNAESEPGIDFFIEEEEEEEKKSPDLGFGSMEGLDEQCKRRGSINTNRHSFPLTLKLLPPPPTFTQRSFLSKNSTSLTNIPRGMHKRADGTIIEFDYPGRREKKSGLTSGLSMTHLNRLGVCFHEDTEEDCQVDQDGLTSHHDYMFSRQAPERKILRNGKGSLKKDFGSAKDLNCISNCAANYTCSISRTSSSESADSLGSRRVSAGTLTMTRHSSAGNVKRHSISTTALDYTGRLANFVRFKNFHLKRHSVLSS